MKRDQWDEYWPDQRAEQEHDLAVRAWYPAGAGLPPRDDQQRDSDRLYAVKRGKR